MAWQGIVAPAGTPKAVVDRLAAEIGRIVTSDTLKTPLRGDGLRRPDPHQSGRFRRHGEAGPRALDQGRATTRAPRSN